MPPAPVCRSIRILGVTISRDGPQCRGVSAKIDTSPALPQPVKAPPKLRYELPVPRAGVSSTNARYDFLKPETATAEYTAMQARLRTPELPRGCAVGGRVNGLAPTDEELATVRRAIEALGPLKRCDNHPVQHFALLDELADKTCKVGGTAGQWFTGGGDTIFLRRSPADDLETYSLHELAHALMHSHDPRTCTSYNDPKRNPLFVEWTKRVGWNEEGTALTSAPGNRAPTAYAATSATEDMAESFALYVRNPEALRAASPQRHLFFASLLEALRASPTPPAGVEPVTFDSVLVEPRK